MANKAIDSVKVSDIHLDHNNPRLPKSIQQSGEKAILNWMLVNANLLELMVSITENGYFDGEPILIIPHETLKGKYTVVEGNRRLSAVKILSNPSLVSKMERSIGEIVENAKNLTPKELPVLKFDKESDILDYLGYRHITGIKQWSPLAKAIYLDRLYRAKKDIKDSDEKYRVLANIIGSKAAYVKRMHTTFRVYERAEAANFYDIPGVNEETIEFSNLNDALTKYSHVSAYVKIDFNKKDPIAGIDLGRVKELFRWMFYRHPETHETRLGEVRNLKQLNIVLNPENKYAYEAFRKGESLAKAIALTDEPNKLFTVTLNEAFSRLQSANEMLYSIDKPAPEDADILRKINELSYDFHATVNSKLAPVKKVLK